MVQEQFAFGIDFKKTNPEQVYIVHPDEYFNSWVTRCKFNIETMQFDFDQKKKIDSSYIVGTTVESVCEY